jgi:hypothetical protein
MFVPDYAKPDAPGLHMGFDNTVALYHVVAPEDGFEAAAQAAIALLRDAQARFPDWPRVFYVDIAGHEGDAGGFDPDFYEFQQDFWFSAVAPFVQAFELPLTGGLVNPEPQRNDVPEALVIESDNRPHAGQVLPDHTPGA